MIELLNLISAMYDSAVKVFSDGDGSKVLDGEDRNDGPSHAAQRKRAAFVNTA